MEFINAVRHYSDVVFAVTGKEDCETTSAHSDYWNANLIFGYHVQVITDYIYQLLEEEVKLKKHDVPVSICKSLDILNVNLSV